MAEKTVVEQYEDMIKRKVEQAKELESISPDVNNLKELNKEIDKHQSLLWEYNSHYGNDYGRDYDETYSDPFMTDGERDDAIEKIESVEKFHEERLGTIEKQMELTLNRESIHVPKWLQENEKTNTFQLSDLDVLKDGDLYYVGRQIKIDNEWKPYSINSAEYFPSRDEAIKELASIKVDEITNKIGIYSLEPLTEPSIAVYNKELNKHFEGIEKTMSIEHPILPEKGPYKLYYPDSLEYVKENGRPITFDEGWKASQYGDKYSNINHTINPWVTKDTLNPELKEKIERQSGQILFVKDAPDQFNRDKKHFAISKGDDGKFNVLEVDKTINNTQVKIKKGYPDKEQAHNDLSRMYNEIERGLDTNRSQDMGMSR